MIYKLSFKQGGPFRYMDWIFLFFNDYYDHQMLRSFKGMVTRRCTENGTWFINPETLDTWTNFTDCIPDQSLSKAVQVSQLYVVITTGIRSIHKDYPSLIRRSDLFRNNI